MKVRCDVAVVGSGFAGSLLARILAKLGRSVVLIERGTHPRFAIGESSTPLANLSLERLGVRYGLPDCYRMAAYGRWMQHHPQVRRGLKRGFTFYRHHPGEALRPEERLLVAASPDDSVADSHWLRADVDAHHVNEAIAVGVQYCDRASLERVELHADGMTLTGTRAGTPFTVDAGFVVDATGPAGFLARTLGIQSATESMLTHSALVYSHFEGVRPTADVVPRFEPGPYPDDVAAVHHIIDEGWMYALRFDDGVTSAGFLLTAEGLDSLGSREPGSMWAELIARHPTLADAYGAAAPMRPIAFVPRVQHRLARPTGDRWAVLPHAYAFVDPLFSTGIAWSLLGVERLADAFARGTAGRPDQELLARYGSLLSAEADQADALIAGAYAAMRQFELTAAHAMIYFAAVSWAEIRQRLLPGDAAAWEGFLGAGDPALARLPGEAQARLSAIDAADRESRNDFAEWVRTSIEPRNLVGLVDRARRNLYPADLDVVIARRSLLGMTLEQMQAALPALRGLSPEPAFR